MGTLCEANVVWSNDSKSPCAMSTPLTGIITSEHVVGHVSGGHMNPWAITIADFVEK